MPGVTMSQVAEAAGVSQATVSFVLNGRQRTDGSIGLETQRRVQEAAKRLGYDRDDNRGARQMAARKHGVRILNNVIAVSAATSSAQANPLQYQTFESDILQGIEKAACRHGLDVLICRHYENQLPRLLEKHEVDGIVSLIPTPESLQQITALGIPAVSLISGYEHSHNVNVTNFQGTYDVVRHLVNLGHRDIAYIGHRIAYDVPESALLTASRERFAAYKQAVKDAGLTAKFSDISLIPQALTVEETAIKALWKKSRGKITAVVCYNDVLAMRVIRSLEKMRLRVPEDVSVTGFDDISDQFAFKPSITSVYYDRIQLGQRAVEILLKARIPWLANEKMDLIHEILPVELKVRATTAPPRR